MKPIAAAALILYILAIVTTAQAQSTEFTYQGQLQSSAAAAVGNHDFEFALFDAASGGSQLGPTLARNTVPVANGIFSVSLDFGNQFNGADRFLEIRVRLSGGGSFTALAPRQRVNSTPYAVKSVNAETAATFSGSLAGDVTGTQNATTVARLQGRNISNAAPLGSQFLKFNDTTNEWAPATLVGTDLPSGSNSYIRNGSAAQTGNFNISGNGTVGGAMTASQFNTGGQRVFVARAIGNTFAGEGSGLANGFGNFNSFFGTDTGRVNSSGESNSFFGDQSGRANTTGSSNAFFGTDAGKANTSGGSNSFFGRESGLSNTTGDNNAFFGRESGKANTTGFRNSFFGVGAGASTTSGDSNSFFGTLAGTENTIGTSNAFFGIDSGNSNTSGSFNAFIGQGSGSGNTTGGSNVFVGAATGANNVTGSGNTLIGAAGTLGAGNLTNATAIGSLARVTQSHSIVLGRINGVGGAVNDTNVGIGTTAPTHPLTIGAPEPPELASARIGVYRANGSYIMARDTSNDVETFIGSDASNIDGVTGSGIVGTMTANGLSFRTNNATRMFLTPSGVLGINVLGAAGGTALCRNNSNHVAFCSSSLRYKTNVKSFTPGLAFVDRLRPISFDWKDGGMKDVGFGAEDIAAIDPRFVTYNDKGEVEGVKYDRLGAVMVNAIKEQQKQIDQQRVLIAEQQEQLNQFKKLLCSKRSRSSVCRK
jgi:hypothetical protein